MELREHKGIEKKNILEKAKNRGDNKMNANANIESQKKNEFSVYVLRNTYYVDLKKMESKQKHSYVKPCDKAC